MQHVSTCILRMFATTVLVQVPSRDMLSLAVSVYIQVVCFHMFSSFKSFLLMFGYILQKLDESMNIRNTWFQRAKKSLTLRTKLYFMNNLAARNYSGKLNVSHKNETIEPTV